MFPFKLDTWLLDTNAEVREEGIVLDNRFFQHQSKTVYFLLLFLSYCEHVELGGSMNIEIFSFRAFYNELSDKGENPDKFFKLEFIWRDKIVGELLSFLYFLDSGSCDCHDVAWCKNFRCSFMHKPSFVVIFLFIFQSQILGRCQYPFLNSVVNFFFHPRQTFFPHRVWTNIC